MTTNKTKAGRFMYDVVFTTGITQGVVLADDQNQAWAYAIAAYGDRIKALRYDEWYDRRWFVKNEQGEIVEVASRPT